jgi:hypothetical protein
MKSSGSNSTRMHCIIILIAAAGTSCQDTQTKYTLATKMEACQMHYKHAYACLPAWPDKHLGKLREKLHRLFLFRPAVLERVRAPQAARVG